ncbi:MAG: acetate kinase [Armatimonadetes bacterium]|nr:acetate kinase [Armatimonadota bacterium]
MNVFVLNCGSSTLKFQVVETDLPLIERDADRRLASGIIERIGTQALVKYEAPGKPAVRTASPVRDHRAGIDMVLRWVISDTSGIEGIRSMADIHAVGHRVVHGGEKLIRSVGIDDDVIHQIEDCIELAPLHNPANLKGIRAARELLGDGVPQVAVFDTAFHATMPERSYLYGIPYQYYRRYKIRRYGFHGTSHRYVSYRYRKWKSLPREGVDIISLHLGNGASACAVQKGESIDTSMGFTPLEGLLMGTRCGDIDPSIVEFLTHMEGVSVSEVDTMLNKSSGLLGISGLTGDMRELLEEEEEKQDRRARLAIDVFCHRVRKYVGAYFAEMGGAQAVVFTGGIGENSAVIRERICKGLECLGMRLDAERNRAPLPVSPHIGVICEDNSPVEICVIPTNEELLIARDTVRCVHDVPRRW